MALAAIAAAGFSAAFATNGVARPDAPRSAAATTKKKLKKVVKVRVIATEFRFKLSRKRVPLGKVIFVVVNKGKIAHDFKIAGKRTKLIAPGKSAKLAVTFKKSKRYPYLCTVPGHAAAGMKGVLPVGKASVVSTTTTTAPPTTTTVAGPATTVTVSMVEYSFVLSQSTIPSGEVTFVITDNGSEVHNFDLLGVKAGKIISPGQSETWTVGLKPGTYEYQCDVPFHADRGMVGQLTVTPSS